MATWPLWAVGRHVTAFTLTPQTINASTGVLADTTPVATLYGRLNNVEIESRNNLENLSAMDRQFENMVSIEKGTTYRCEVFDAYGAVNPLTQAAYGFDVFKIALTRGAESFTGYGIAANYRLTAQKSRVMSSFELMPIDIGGTSANPAYA